MQSSFVAALSPAGDRLEFSTYFGGVLGPSHATDLVVAGDGSIVVGGVTYAPDFPLVNPAQPTHGGMIDCFITRLTPNGRAVLSSTYFGGSEDDLLSRVAVDDDGTIYVCGGTESTDLTTTADAFQPGYRGGSQHGLVGTGDAFFARLAREGGTFEHVTYLGSSNEDFGYSLDLDARGNVYLSGYASSPDFPVTPGAIQSDYGGDGPLSYPRGDAFVTCLSASGYVPLYSTLLGTEGSEAVRAIAVSSEGTAAIVGITTSQDFPLVRPLAGRIGNDPIGGFMAEISSPIPSISSAVFKSASGTLKIAASAPLAGEVSIEINGQRISPPLASTVNEARGRVRVAGSAADLNLDVAGKNVAVLVVGGVASEPRVVQLR
jgi:hypothetical protein